MVRATTALMAAVLEWARESGRPVSDADARSWDEWPNGHESFGMNALRRRGRYNRISEDLLKEWQAATGRGITEVDNDSPRTGHHRAMTVV